MPDINASLNEGRGEEENTHEKEASGLTQAESKSPEKEIKASGSSDRKNSCNHNKPGWVDKQDCYR